jgi:aryl-alcohol dehydrogenase-like predicted oxidoreductase
MSSRLALGTVQFGLPYGIANHSGQVAADEAGRIISCARENRVLTIDTAMTYGQSEKVLGNIGMDDFDVISKLPQMPSDIKDVDAWVMKQVISSLERLGVSKLHGLLLHQPSQLSDDHGKSLVAGLNHVKNEGLLEKIGISIYSPTELSGAMEMMDVQIVQAPFNLLDRQLFVSGWMDSLFRAGIEIHARSIFLQGLLLLNDSGVRKKFQKWNELWEKWDLWLAEKSLSPIQACLGFVESYPQISKIIVGIDSKTQLRELIAHSGKVDIAEFPDLDCNDLDLINPSRWKLA